MSRGGFFNKGSPKGKPQEMNWKDWVKPLCVAESGWEEEPKKVWDCTTCKKYVKMTHLSKIWPRKRAEVQVRRWEGQMSTCESQHFVRRYEEITSAGSLPVSKPNVMNYSNMAMIWAEIVLHKEVDWRTLAGRNVTNLTREHTMIDTNWVGPSDCLPMWSNRGQFGFPEVVLPDAEDDSSDDNDVHHAPAPVTFGERHNSQEAREDIEFEQQMQEAMRRSMEDRGRQYGYDASYQHDRGARVARDSGRSSQSGTALQSGSQSGGGNHGNTSYSGSNHGDLQHYPVYHGSTPHGSYGHHSGSYYGISSEGGSQYNAPFPPPTFGNSSYMNYGEGGAPTGYGYNDGRGAYGGSSSTYRQEGDDSTSESD